MLIKYYISLQVRTWAQALTGWTAWAKKFLSGKR